MSIVKPDRDLHRRAADRSLAHPLDAIFTPRSVAVIGATEQAGSVGRTILWNLVSNPFGGAVFPVNPRREHVLGIRAYPSIEAVPEPVDLAVVVTPAATVPDVIGDCGAAGVRGAIVISAGFREEGPEGAALEEQLLDRARAHGMRIIGPNSLGVMSPVSGLNASFASGMARPGTVGFLSQSGALCTAVLDWSFQENVGFSAFVSIGAMADVGWGDLIDYLGSDTRTRAIVVYMESVGNARAFLSAAREVALQKPIIVIKAGRTRAAARAAASHTGALTGSDEVLDAAFSRCGVLRVNTIAELFSMAEVLGKQPPPRGPRLTVLTNAGGPGVLATDALIAHGGELTTLGEATTRALDAVLPPHWSRGNPIDLLGDASPERYGQALEIAAADEGGDGILVILAPQAATDPTGTADVVRRFGRIPHKPVLASWMGGGEVAAGDAILSRAGIPTFRDPDMAARIFTHMWRYSNNLRSLYETPVLPSGGDVDRAASAAAARALIEAVRNAGRTILTEIESKAVLSHYGIAAVETRQAATVEEAVAAAEAIGYPVVVKLHSETITHKADVGGVHLDLRGAAAVRAAFAATEAAVSAQAGAGHFLGVTVQRMERQDGYELILGSSLDPQFGPVLLFGSGGRLAEVHGDHALGLPPLNTTLARRLMERTRVLAALRGGRGRPPVDVEAVEELLVRFSHLVAEQRGIAEVDVNPVLASPDRVIVLDARMLVHGRAVTEADVPPLAIRPYPAQYVSTFRLRNGREVRIRPIRPEDEPAMVRFHGTLSERSVYFRYFHLIKLGLRVSHERLTRICFIDYDRDMALVAETLPGAGESASILGVGRLTRQRGVPAGEFAILVGDDFQGQGLGTELLRRVVQVGRDQGLARITADILPENRDMQRVAEKVGFLCRYDADSGVVKAEIELEARRLQL